MLNSNLANLGYTFLGGVNAVSQTAFSKDISNFDEIVLTLTCSKYTFASTAIPLNWSRINVLQVDVLGVRGKHSNVEYEGMVYINRETQKTTSYLVSANNVMLEVYGKKIKI